MQKMQGGKEVNRIFPAILLAAVIGCAVYAQSTGGRVGKFERFNPNQFQQSQDVITIGSGASFTNLVLVTPVITYTNGPIFTNTIDTNQLVYDSTLHVKSGALTTNVSFNGGQISGNNITNTFASATTLAAWDSAKKPISATLDANQLTYDANGLHVISGALTTNLTSYGQLSLGSSTTKFRTKGLGGSFGIANLSFGVANVANTNVNGLSYIFYANYNPGGTPGFIYTTNQTNGASFQVKSTSATDNSGVAYWIIDNY